MSADGLAAVIAAHHKDWDDDCCCSEYVLDVSWDEHIATIIAAHFEALADEWVAAEVAADEYGPRIAFDGRDCAEMLRAAIDGTA